MGEGLDTLGPVGRETAQDRVYGQLRDALICGAFDAGETFPVGEVAARMSVSSMPVREALARLVSERALQAQPNRRIRVPPLERERARDIARARTLIEGELATSALRHLAASDLARLEALTDAYETAPDEGAIARANHAFHFTIYRAARSAVLLPFAESLWMQAGPYVREAARLHRPEIDQAATLHHRGVLDALRERDASRLAAELAADINAAFDLLERAWAAPGARTEALCDG